MHLQQLRSILLLQVFKAPTRIAIPTLKTRRKVSLNEVEAETGKLAPARATRAEARVLETGAKANAAAAKARKVEARAGEIEAKASKAEARADVAAARARETEAKANEAAARARAVGVVVAVAASEVDLSKAGADEAEARKLTVVEVVERQVKVVAAVAASDVELDLQVVIADVKRIHGRDDEEALEEDVEAIQETAVIRSGTDHVTEHRLEIDVIVIVVQEIVIVVIEAVEGLRHVILDVIVNGKFARLAV